MDTQQIQNCPTPENLRGLLSGEISVGDQASLTQHIETCPSCQNTLDGWLSSPSVEGLAAAGKDSVTQEAALRDLMALVKKNSRGDETQAEPSASDLDESLAFLAPSKKPEHLGRLGHYEILSIIGKGGFGTVFKAFDEKLHRVVAVKVLAPAIAASGTARKRFIREAQAAAAVKNDHIVAIYNVEDKANPPYLVMELIDGISLEDRLKSEGPLELKEILRIGLQIADGLAAAHKQGLIHRDIKPANILLENGVQRVKITDFGLARLADDASITQSGVIAVTPMYMAPEQAMGEKLDHRADLFSLGSVLFVMCTGRAPFRANSTMAVLKRVCEETPTPIREINSEIPGWLSKIVSKLQEKRADDRFSSAKEVAKLLGERLAEVQSKGGAEARRRTKPSDRPGKKETMPAASPGKQATPALATKPLRRWAPMAAIMLAIVALPILLVTAVMFGWLAWETPDSPDPKSPGPIKKDSNAKVVGLAPKNDGWVQIFNGKDLAGWTSDGAGAGNWSVVDGAITCTGPMSYLYTNRDDFGNFHLRAQVKVNADGNSGIYFRAGNPVVVIGDYEAQITNNPSQDHKTGSLYGLVQVNDIVVPPETWFTYEIIARGKQIRLLVNGKETASYTEVRPDRRATGNIVLQHYSPQTQVYFRKFEIKELPPTPTETQPFVLSSRIVLENNLVVGKWHSFGLHLIPETIDKLDGASVSLRRNTIWANYPLSLSSRVAGGHACLRGRRRPR